MLSSLLRPFQGSPRVRESASPSPGPANREYAQRRHATADFTEADDDDDDSNEDGGPAIYDRGDEVGGEDDEDGQHHSGSVLPLFSSGHLDSLPVYSITHAIRIIVQTRTETTLTWDQLRSPQVSQFLVKPMQLQIRTQHYSRATLYALMANSWQFVKEAQLYPGNAGTSSTRAKVCELLAIKLLKEYTTRELIDALSYDFYPLQGIPGPQTQMTPGGNSKSSAARTSTLEVAIRASAKHFLSHPLVVQQLEAIWNGAISFYSSADSLHRSDPVATGAVASGSRSRRESDQRTPLLSSASQPSKHEHERPSGPTPGRRSVTLYDPRNASLFKLSRLRVPRYRQYLSTCSLAILIGLFLAVLIRRSSRITTLELVFWFWSAGFMLDELVGFNEQGFSLYIMSFWNIFDLGILLLLIVYYCMRVYGVFLLDPHKWNENAYDVLAANAILLLPRIFSVLDHYQYFSQLLIAFRLMAVDLAAVLVLVLISCSGFFVFFTLSRNENNGSEVAYKIFQILMGFTPAAWEVWPTYNWLGKMLMGFFLIICHFVVVTILITVLTNSFMAIASNANEEHQFLFAINAVSMVKNDALFSYVAPGNIFAWALMPLRYCMPLRHFVSLNRLVIKVTHFPILLCIYIYERYFLAPSIYEPTDLVDYPGRSRQRGISLVDPASRTALFSPNILAREESVVGFQKARALEEVFRRAPDLATRRTQRRNERRKTQTAIRSWMDQNDGPYAGSAHHNFPTIAGRAGPTEWQRRSSMSRDVPRRFRQFSDVRSAASDPADLVSNNAFPTLHGWSDERLLHRAHADPKDNTDADGDDELVTNDEEEEEDNATNIEESRRDHKAHALEEDYFTTPVAPRFGDAGSSAQVPPSDQPDPRTSPRTGQTRRGNLHNRTLSTNTILYNPQDSRRAQSSSASPEPSSRPRSRPLSTRHTPTATPTTGGGGGYRSPRRSLYLASRPRSILPARNVLAQTQIAPPPTRPTLQALDIPPALGEGGEGDGGRTTAASRVTLRRPSSADDAFAAVPASFATQMAVATGMITPLGLGGKEAARLARDKDSGDRMSRLVLARMKTLEEGFAEMVREMRELRGSAAGSAVAGSGDDGSWKGRKEAGHGPAPGLATIEIAGRPRERDKRRAVPSGGGLRRSGTTTSRPGERRPGRGAVVDAGSRDKGKGKAVLMSEDDLDDDPGEAGFTRRGSSF